MTQLDTSALEAGLHEIRQSPTDRGTVEMIARRPAIDQREIIPEGELDPEHGLVGDTWTERPSRRTGRVHVERQVTLMNSRVADLVAAGDKARWALAGDQLYVDFDLSQANLPPGTRLAVGAAELEVSAEPHTGCDKFTERFGPDAMRFVNSAVGRALSLRGINARVVSAGQVRVGDTIRKA